MVTFIVQHLNIHYEETVNTQQQLLVNVSYTQTCDMSWNMYCWKHRSEERGKQASEWMSEWLLCMLKTLLPHTLGYKFCWSEDVSDANISGNLFTYR